MCWAYCFSALFPMYMHESKFLTESLFPFLLRMLHAPTYAPSSTPASLPQQQPALLFSHRGDLMERPARSSFPASCGKPVSCDRERAATTRQQPPGNQRGSPAWGQLALSCCYFDTFDMGLGFSTKPWHHLTREAGTEHPWPVSGPSGPRNSDGLWISQKYPCLCSRN